MADIIPALSIIALNVNGLNNPIKGQRLPDYIKIKKIQYIICTGHRLYFQIYKLIESKRM